MNTWLGPRLESLGFTAENVRFAGVDWGRASTALGSTLFFVWQQQREGLDPYSDLAATRDVTSAFRDPARNVFLVKASYWLGR